MPSFLAAALAVFRSRDAIATTSRSLLLSMPGMTFSVPILAVEMIPHFTGDIDAGLPLKGRNVDQTRRLVIHPAPSPQRKLGSPESPPLAAPRHGMPAFAGVTMSGWLARGTILIVQTFNKETHAQSPLRYPVPGDEDRPGHGAEPLLSDAACNRHGMARTQGIGR